MAKPEVIFTHPTSDGVERALSIDPESGELYWGGKKVVTVRTLGLTFWQRLGAFLTVTSAVVVAAFTVMAYFKDTSGCQ